MSKEVIMPKFGFTQEDGTIVRWLKQEGDHVERGDPLLEVTTDKVNMEVEAPEDGILAGLQYQEGATVPVTVVIAYILSEGEALPELPAILAKPSSAGVSGQEALPPRSVHTTPVARRVAEVEGVDITQVPGTGPGGKIIRQDVEQYRSGQTPQPVKDRSDGKLRATPAARRAAREHGLNLMEVPGSGPQSRVQEADVIALARQPTPAQPALLAVRPFEMPVSAQESVVIPLEGMRRTIAERMQASAQQAPHVMFTLDIDMTRATSFREDANARLGKDQGSISMTAIIIKAAAWTLRQHPIMNSYLHNNQIIILPYVNVGMAVALEDGLIVPVIRNADTKGLAQIGAEVVELAARARDGRLRPSDVTDGTFTVSNLGMYGIDHFTAIINTPQVGILAVGRIARRFVPDENDQPVVKPIMTVTLSTDHRVVDGANAAQFVATLRDALEEPARIVL